MQLLASFTSCSLATIIVAISISSHVSFSCLAKESAIRLNLYYTLQWLQFLYV
jgi:hypothetical protein